MPSRSVRPAEIAVLRSAQPRTAHEAVGGATERRLAGAMEVPLEQLIADPDQPRRDWEHDHGAQRLQELAGSIREFGVLQPLLVREDGALPNGRQRYVIIAGARRRAAAALAGVQAVPVLVRDEPAARVRALALLENLQRQDLSPLDEARAYQELLDLEGLTPTALAVRLHLSGQQVRDRLRLLADQVLADAVERRQISASAAREIMKLPDDEVLAFRARVLAGERLQLNDVFSARARLAAAGITNPRRKVAAPAPDVEIAEAPVGGLGVTPIQLVGASRDQTLFDPELTDMNGDGEGRRDSGDAAVALLAVAPGSYESGNGTDPGATASIAQGGLYPGETREVRANRLVDLMDASLQGERRAAVAAALLAGAEGDDLPGWLLLVYRGLAERLGLRLEERSKS